MNTNRTTEVLAAVVAVFGARSLRDADPKTAFADLVQRVPELTATELETAADRAKALASEIRGLAWRLAKAEANERRKNSTR